MRQLRARRTAAGLLSAGAKSRAPEGALISLACEGGFTEPQREKPLAGMLIGQVYRLKVVEHSESTKGEEVFPTIEVIDRLYPPPGQAARFPIPIELTQEELEMRPRRPLRAAGDLRRRAADGPARPRRCPASSGTSKSRPDDDAMEVADRLGRPMAILRMGSRVPLAGRRSKPSSSISSRR